MRTLPAASLFGLMCLGGALSFPVIAAATSLPEVLTGLSLLLLFVAMERWFGWPSGRGATTVTLAHTAVSVAYVAVVVRARLAENGIALEEAAADLYRMAAADDDLLAPAHGAEAQKHGAGVVVHHHRCFGAGQFGQQPLDGRHDMVGQDLAEGRQLMGLEQGVM